MSYQTYLEYTIAPNPLTEGETQDLIVIATLKQGVGLTSATISQIVLDFGDVGSGATDLTNTAFTLANIQMPVGWIPTVSGVTCTLTSSGTAGLVSTDDALIFTIQGVQVNTAIGNVTLTVSEAATPAPQIGGVPPTTTPANPGVETIVLPKLAASEIPFTLRADPESISAGENTTLNWSGGGVNDTYSLLYISCGNLTTITAHADGTLLSADDVYPDTDLSPQDPLLALNSSGTFILQATSGGGVITYVTTQVIVSQPDLYANSLQISGFVDTHSQGAYLEWNKDGGTGKTYLLNQMGLGSGGFVIGEVDTANNITEQVSIDLFGNVVAGSGRISDKTGPVMPVGSVIAWAGMTGSTGSGYLPITPPKGWLICDGSAIPAQYADLIALVGTNTPNLCGRTLIGTGVPTSGMQSDGTTPNFNPANNWPVGYTGGEFVHTLVEGEMPTHNHTVGGYNNQPNNIADNSDDISCPDCWMWNDTKATTFTGNNQAHNTMQPYYAINYIIKC